MAVQEMNSRFAMFRNALADLGSPVRDGAVVLDFGCGDGDMVKQATQEGFAAYGCDLPTETGLEEVKDARALEAMKAGGQLRQISVRPYRLPFDDQFFDAVISDQVFDHVQDYPETLAELRRVMKPGAAFLHAFPSRYCVIEPSVRVPGATIIRARWWLMAWAVLGVRNPNQRGRGASEVATLNAMYLDRFTNYLPPTELKRQFGVHFRDVRFVERECLAYSRRAKIFKTFGLSAVYGLLWARYLYGRAGHQ